MGLFSWLTRKKRKPIIEMYSSNPPAARSIDPGSLRKSSVTERRRSDRFSEKDLEIDLDLDMSDVKAPEPDHSYMKPGVPLQPKSSYTQSHHSVDDGHRHSSYSSYDSGSSSSSYDSGSSGGCDSGGGGGSCGGGGD